VMEQIYSHYDTLVSTYPDYIRKIDVVEFINDNLNIGMQYPEYCNLGGNEGTIDHTIPLSDNTTFTYRYKATPSYKVWLYKLSDISVGAGNTTSHPKKKLFITTGLHPNEMAAPFNAYLFMKNLCESSDRNFDLFRSSYDDYIIPCLCGYSMYHLARCNANYVNLNRNFPTSLWTLSGNSPSEIGDTLTQLFNNNYSGPTAGSEFETQIVVDMISILNPEMYIDHHNYGISQGQFYTDLYKEEILPLAYQCLSELSYIWRKGLPQYFGNKHKLFIFPNTGHAPASCSYKYGSTSSFYAYEINVPFASTIEIGDRINFTNGELNTQNSQRDVLGSDTFSVGEVTLRLQLFKYAQEILKRNQLL